MFEKILVPVDGSAVAASALSHALAVTQENASITLMRVVESSQSNSALVDPVDWQLRRTEASIYLDELGDECADRCGITIEKVVEEGTAAERILAQVQKDGHDLLVISTHGRNGLSGWTLSSVTQKVMARSGVSILLVRAHQSLSSPSLTPLTAAKYRHVLVPLDGSLRAEHVLPAATRLAKQHGAELVLVHGVVTPELFQQTPIGAEDSLLINQVVERNRRLAERYLSDLSQRLDVETKTLVLVGDNVSETLHRFIEQCDVDLVILSAHGRSGKHAWPYGSMTTNFCAYGTTHLLIVQDLPWQQMEESNAAQAYKISKLASISSAGHHATTSEGRMMNINAFALHSNRSNRPQIFWG